MPKKAILLLSPGGTGNHLWDEILQTAGSIKYGDDDDGKCSTGDPEGDFIHWFRSMPNRVYPLDEIGRMVDYLRSFEYEVFGLVPVRDWYCVIRSQRREPHLQEAAAVINNLLAGYPAILNTYAKKNVPFMLVTYSEATHQPKYVKWVLEYLGLPSGNLPEIRDENAKWYK